MWDLWCKKRQLTLCQIQEAAGKNDVESLIEVLEQWHTIWGSLTTVLPSTNDPSPAAIDLGRVVTILWEHRRSELIEALPTLVPEFFMHAHDLCEALQLPGWQKNIDIEQGNGVDRGFNQGQHPLNDVCADLTQRYVYTQQRSVLLTEFIFAQQFSLDIRNVQHTLMRRLFTQTFHGGECQWTYKNPDADNTSEGHEKSWSAGKTAREFLLQTTVDTALQAATQGAPETRFTPDEWRMSLNKYQLLSGEDCRRVGDKDLADVLSQMEHTTLYQHAMQRHTALSFHQLGLGQRSFLLSHPSMRDEMLKRLSLAYVAGKPGHQQGDLLRECSAVCQPGQAQEVLSALALFLDVVWAKTGQSNAAQPNVVEPGKTQLDAIQMKIAHLQGECTAALAVRELSDSAHALYVLTHMICDFIAGKSSTSILHQTFIQVGSDFRPEDPVWMKAVSIIARDSEHNTFDNATVLGSIADELLKETHLACTFAGWIRAFQAELLAKRGHYDYALRVARYGRELLEQYSPIGVPAIQNLISRLAQGSE